MSTFDTFIWWYGVILFTISCSFFYGLLIYSLIQWIRDKFFTRERGDVETISGKWWRKVG